MSKREIAALVLRMYAIHLFLGAIEKFRDFAKVGVELFDEIRKAGMTTAVPAFGATTGNNWSVFSPMGTIRPDNVPLMIAANCVWVAVWFFIAGYLWFAAPRLSHSLVQQYADEKPINTRGIDIQRVAFSLFGMWMLVGLVPNLVGNIIAWLWEAVRWTGQSAGGFFRWPITFYDLIYLVVGLWLILGTRGIVGVIYKTRQWARESRRAKNTALP